MDRVQILVLVLFGLGLVWLAWQGAKLWLRRSIRVEQSSEDGRSPTLVYFSGSNCAPCRLQQAPIVDSLRQTMGIRARFQEYDALEHPDLARRYHVLTVPTTVVISPGGEVVAVNHGLTQVEKLRRQLAEAAHAGQ